MNWLRPVTSTPMEIGPYSSLALKISLISSSGYADWKAHGIQAIRECRETRPTDYLKIVTVIVSKCADLSLADDMRDAAMEEFIEERRQQASSTMQILGRGWAGCRAAVHAHRKPAPPRTASQQAYQGVSTSPDCR
jgi:hypothetical protein